MQTHSQKDLELEDFSFFIIFIYCFVSNTLHLGERIFRLEIICLENEAAIFLSDTLLCLFWGEEPSLFILHSALLAVKAQFTLGKFTLAGA